MDRTTGSESGLGLSDGSQWTRNDFTFDLKSLGRQVTKQTRDLMLSVDGRELKKVYTSNCYLEHLSGNTSPLLAAKMVDHGGENVVDKSLGYDPKQGCLSCPSAIEHATCRSFVDSPLPVTPAGV